MTAKTVLKRLIPPLFLDAIPFGRSYSFRGDFDTWEEALRHSRGYSASGILEKVKAAALKVKEGQAAFERDAVAFHNPEYPWELLMSLLWIAALNGGKLSVLDFGGSLGSTFFQCRKFLSPLAQVRWSVVEQPHFVQCGREHFEDGEIKFHPDLDASVQWQKPQVILFGSVLQYLEHPYEMLSKALRLDAPFLIVDRTPFIEGAEDRLRIQKISSRIYPASYPAWFLSRPKFLQYLSGSHELFAELPCSDGSRNGAKFTGYLFQRRA